MITIQLNKLARHPGNVRKAAATGIAELAASIERDGLLQNLTVVDGTCDKGKHWVVAGGRRLAALQLLAKQKKLPEDFPVPARVVAPGDAEAVSLAENQMREQMHPADQFDAFKNMVDASESITDVASRFGVTESFVRQRLKLTAVAPGLLAEYRAGGMRLEQLQAFTVTDDHARQIEAWDRAKSREYLGDPDHIKDFLLNGVVDARDSRLKFVGEAAYKKAGGAIIAVDLFAGEDDIAETLSDSELLDKLVLAKLQKHAAKVKKTEGLAWCESQVHFSIYSSRDYERAPTITRAMTDAEAEIYKQIEEELEALQEKLDEIQYADDVDIAEELKITKAMEPLEAERDAIDDALETPRADCVGYIGAMVSLGDDGAIETKRNIIKTADLKMLDSFAKKQKQADKKPQPVADDQDDDDDDDCEMQAGPVTLTGRIVEVGDLEDGAGIGVRIMADDDRDLAIIGLTESECRSMVPMLWKEIEIKVFEA